MSAWYKDGLRFTCTRCGNCCTGAPGVVWVDDAEIAGLARFLGVSPEEARDRWTRQIGGPPPGVDAGPGWGPARRSLREYSDGSCIFWDKVRGCTVYAVRPRQCRTWPFWDSCVATPEAWERTQETCPGAGEGELHTAEEISRRRAVVKV
jgi:Fe-S-cluster containining protein